MKSSPGGNRSENEPAASVKTELSRLPFTGETIAPAMGALASSTTEPVTVASFRLRRVRVTGPLSGIFTHSLT
jgi:hypothetical protein